MSAEMSSSNGELIERLGRGDIDAAKELTGRFYDRIARIAGRIYRDSYPSLNGRHELESILGEAWIRLMKAIEKRRPRTVEVVYGLAIRHVRYAFLDVIKKQRRDDARRPKPAAEADRSGVPAFDPASSTLDPLRRGGSGPKLPKQAGDIAGG